jgi:FkbM family methyltransferase
MRYSQNLEQDYILAHFKDKQGVFLDLGAYDGKDLSNTRALMELGWGGVCFEPNPDIFERLATNCMEFKNVLCYEMAIGKVNGTFKLNANDTYYSTLIDSETERWKGAYEFKTIECEVIDFNTFMLTSPLKTFNFISIDCEGIDYDVLTQIDLDKVGCEMVCVETNGKETQKYIDYISKFDGFRVIHVNAENLIMAR